MTEYSVSINADESNECLFSNSTIKSRLLTGEYKFNNKRGRSNVWNIFGKIENELGQEINNIVGCRKCLNVYKFNKKSTSNLVKHKCYILLTEESSSTCKIEVDAETKNKAVQIFTEWTIVNCRPFRIVEDSGLKKVGEFFISLGAKHGKNVDISSVLPHPTTVSRNINKLYQTYFQKVSSEISSIKNIGFGLTSDIWTDNYIRKSFLSLTIHYIKDGNLVVRLLGMKSMEGQKCTHDKIILKIIKLLKEFNCDLNDNVIIVTDRGSNMIAAFREYNHINCVNHLIHNSLQKSIEEVNEVENLCQACCKLVKYFKKSGLNSTLCITLKSFSPTRWNTVYYLFVSIEKNWAAIVQILQEKQQMNRIRNINLNEVSVIIKLLEPFQESFKKLEGENYATLHLVIVHIHNLGKACAESSEDLLIIKNLKVKLSGYLDTVVMANLTIYHKIALFLFPPANKLLPFNENEKQLIKSECKQIMKSYIEDASEIEEQNDSTLRFSNSDIKMFYDFVLQDDNINARDKINSEIHMYESVKVMLHDDFNILQWWEQHKNEFPLLYKTSCKILAAPATSASSERTFSIARNLISDKRCSIATNDTSINQIMFLNSNIDKNELQKELIYID